MILDVLADVGLVAVVVGFGNNVGEVEVAGVYSWRSGITQLE